MIRLFEQHHIRRQYELAGTWKLVTEDGESHRMLVPGCWEQLPELRGYRGKGTYYKEIRLERETGLRLECKGVSHTAELYLDDVPVAHHYNAYTGFTAVIAQVKPGLHRLKVAVDNTFSEASALHIPNDYYTYGGITRPVVAEEIPPIYIERLHFTPELKKGKWYGRIEAVIRNLGAAAQVKLALSLAGQRLVRELSLNEEEEQLVCVEEAFEGVSTWSPVSPGLYLLEAVLYQERQAIDDLVERVGFREITLKGSKLLINGRHFFMKGFNRHEDYGTLGCAVPVQIMQQDLDLMREMGANAVRTCHYPNDERFLDLCDERGILVWEEAHARGLSLEKMENPNFDRQSRGCIEEMLGQHHNHPSIVIWGILNECASETKEGREKYRLQYEQIRTLDTSRPVTSATCRHFTDLCLDLPDVVSFNLYSGWYQDVPIRQRFEQEMDWIRESGGGDKPVIVSEFGAAAIYGYRDRGRGKWSEERQADIIRENIRVFQKDQRLTGMFIWQFADCKVTDEEWFATRARGHNNKGVVDEYRRPKEAFETVRELYTAMSDQEETFAYAGICHTL